MLRAHGGRTRIEVESWMSYPLPPEEALGGEYLPIGLYRSSLSGKILAANTALAR